MCIFLQQKTCPLVHPLKNLKNKKKKIIHTYTHTYTHTKYIYYQKVFAIFSTFCYYE